MRRLLRSSVIVAAFGLASVVNPGYFSGCTSDLEFEFGEAEMLDLLDEANAAAPFEIAPPGANYRLELSLSQELGQDSELLVSLLARRAYACGSRTFLQGASACYSSTRMPLRARYSLIRIADGGEETTIVHDGELTGELDVNGPKLRNGSIILRDRKGEMTIQLRSPDGSEIELHSFASSLDGASFIL